MIICGYSGYMVDGCAGICGYYLSMVAWWWLYGGYA